MKTKSFFAGIAVLNFIAQSQLHAQATWTSSTLGGDWATPGNWTVSAGSAPSSNNGTPVALTFDTATANRTYTNTLTNFTASSITVNSGSRDNTVTGNAITLGGTFTVGTGNWQNFGIGMSLGAVRTFAIDSGQLTLSGDLTGASGGISKSGGGQLIISGNNSIGAAQRLNITSTSTVVLTSASALGAAATGTGTVSGQNGNGHITFTNNGAAVLSIINNSAINSYGLDAGSSSTGGTVTLGRATAGTGYVQNFAYATLGSRTMTFNQGSNVSSGNMTASIANVGLSAGNNDRVVTLNGSAAISLGDVATTANAGNNRRLGLAGTNANNAVTGVISNLATGVTGSSVLSLIKSDSSTWTLTGANTYTGITTIAGGTLQIGNGGATGTLSSSSAIQNGGILAFNRTGTITQGTDFAGTIGAYTTDFSSNTAGVALVTPVLGRLVKSASGNLILNGSNTLNATDSLTFSGSDSGTVTLRNAAALGAAGNSVRFSGGGSGVLDLQTDSSVNAYNISSGTFNGGTIISNRATTGAGITHTLGVLDLSSVTLTANTGGNVTSGTARVSFTELRMTGGNDNQPVTLAGSAAISVGSSSITNNGISKRLQLDGTNSGNSIGAITDTNNATAGSIVNVIKANSSTWTLNGTNTYTGTTAVNGGTLKANTTQAFGTNSAVTIANTAGAVLDLNDNNNSIGSLTGGGATGGNITLGSAKLTVGGNNTSPSAYAGVISGTGSLSKTGSGTLILSGINTFSGGTTVDNGTLTLSNGGAAGAIRGTLTVNSGATVTTTAGDALGYNVGTKVNTLNIIGGTLTHNSASNLTLSSATVNMTGGTLQSTGAGVIDIYDAQALGGGNPDSNTAINTLANSTTATIAGKLRLRQGDNDATGTVFNVANGAATIDLEVSAIMEDGPFQGAASAVQKTGAGTMLLSSNNTYTGTTTIKGGTLKLNSSTAIANSSTITVGDTGSSGAVLDVTAAGLTVGSTQTLGGIGTILATGRTVTASGTISAGNSVGILSIDGGTLALDSTSKFTFELGTSSDLISLLNLATLNLGSGTLGLSDFTFSDSGGFTDGVYNLITGAASFTGTLDTGNLTGSVLGRDGTLSMSGNNLILTVVPEPSAALIGSLGLLALLRRRRVG